MTRASINDYRDLTRRSAGRGRAKSGVRRGGWAGDGGAGGKFLAHLCHQAEIAFFKIFASKLSKSKLFWLLKKYFKNFCGKWDVFLDYS